MKFFIDPKVLPNKNLVIGDVHLGRESNSLSVFHNTEKYFYSLIPEFERMKANGEKFFITFMGDTYDSSSSVNTYISSRFVTVIKKYLEYADHIIFLVGNHDTFTKHDNESNSILALGLHDRIHVVIGVNHYKTESGSLLSYVSHIDNEERLVSTIESLDPDTIPFIHQEINGFLYKGKDSESALKKEHLAKFKKVVNGHIHNYQDSGNILITGSMEQCNFGESNSNNHSFLIHHSTEVFTYEKLPNLVSPRYHRLKYSDVMNMSADQYSAMANGHNVRITCKNNDEVDLVYKIIKNDESAIQTRIEKELNKKTIIISDTSTEEHKNLSDMIYDTAVELTNKSEISDKQKKIVLEKLKKYHKR